jgi:hypothetical protein
VNEYQCSIDKENKISTENWLFFLTPIGSNNYINVIFFKGAESDGAIPASWDKRKMEGYGLFKIKVEEDKLVLWFGDPKAAKAAIQREQLKGTVKEHSIPDINIFGGDNLAHFLANGGDKALFPDSDKMKALFTRVK